MKIVIVTCGTCTWEFWIIVCYMRREKSVFSRNYLRTLRGRQHLFKKKKLKYTSCEFDRLIAQYVLYR